MYRYCNSLNGLRIYFQTNQWILPRFVWQLWLQSYMTSCMIVVLYLREIREYGSNGQYQRNLLGQVYLSTSIYYKNCLNSVAYQLLILSTLERNSIFWSNFFYTPRSTGASILKGIRKPFWRLMILKCFL